MKLRVYISNKKEFLAGNYFRGLILVDEKMTEWYEGNGSYYLHDVEVNVDWAPREFLLRMTEDDRQAARDKLKEQYVADLLELEV
jgi:hypothetical protein